MNTLKKLLLVSFVVMSTPVINPDNALPGDWFTPTGQSYERTVQIERATDAANRAYVCAVYKARTGLDHADCSL
jgi:hypothetical protein